MAPLFGHVARYMHIGDRAPVAKLCSMIKADQLNTYNGALL